MGLDCEEGEWLSIGKDQRSVSVSKYYDSYWKNLVSSESYSFFIRAISLSEEESVISSINWSVE